MKPRTNSAFALFIVCVTTFAFCSSLSGQQDKPDATTEQGSLGLFCIYTADSNWIVIETTPGSPAAGVLYVNDILLGIDDQNIDETTSPFDLTSSRKPGEEVTVKVNRMGKTQTVKLTLAARSKDSRPGSKFQQISIASEDKLPITADLYQNVEAEAAPFIVLCHQAGWSRGEYREIAPKLNRLGFNCVAIDQRSGKAVGVKNETVQKATKAGKQTGFVDAQQDIVAALKWAKEKNPKSKIILWGSSYSSALSLRIAGEHPELVDGVLAFAPGEYFARFGKPKNWITTSAKKIAAPVFITSSKAEAGNWQPIFDAIPTESKVKFIPTTAGNHGSRALWERFSDNAAYWESVEKFLSQF